MVCHKESIPTKWPTLNRRSLKSYVTSSEWRSREQHLAILWGNGITERFNRTLLNMLGTLDSNQNKDWKSHVSGLVHAYNCARQTTTTGFYPYFLMFGRTPRLSIDIAFGLEVEGKKEPSTKYVKTMKERLKKAYELASGATRTAQERQKW